MLFIGRGNEGALRICQEQNIDTKMKNFEIEDKKKNTRQLLKEPTFLFNGLALKAQEAFGFAFSSDSKLSLDLKFQSR